MKRILFLHHVSSVGGGSYCLLNIIKALDKTLFEPIVALKTHGPLEAELKKTGVEVIFFPQMSQIPYNVSLLRLSSLLAYLAVFRSLGAFEQLLIKEKIDILYLNNMMISPYLLSAKKIGCKTIMHVREHWPLDEHKNQLEWVRKIVYDNCDEIVAINNYSASIFPKKKATIVYDWIDMSGRDKNIPMQDIFKEDMAGKKILLYTGGAQRIKGIDYIVDAFMNAIKGDEYRLLLLGCDNLLLSGWKHKVKKFLSVFGYHYWGKEMLEKIEKDSRIKRIGAVYELNHLVEQSYCFVSYFVIPHANLALAENIILGNASIAADTEEAREYSHNGEYAKLVNPMNDYDVFANSLREFLNEIEIWRNAAKKGSSVVSLMFDKHKNIEVLNGVLKKVYNS